VWTRLQRPLLEAILAREDVGHVELVLEVVPQDSAGDPETPRRSFWQTMIRLLLAIWDWLFWMFRGTLWNLDVVQAPALWNGERLRGKGVVVAVIDGGVDLDHPHLSGRGWDGRPQFPYHGENFEAPGTPPHDDKGHGTGCAGLIAGRNIGVAPGAAIMALRVNKKDCLSWKAFQFALKHGAHVINYSLMMEALAPSVFPCWLNTCRSVLAAKRLLACAAGDQGLLAQLPNIIGPAGNCPPPWLHPAQTHPASVSAAATVGSMDKAFSVPGQSGRGPSEALPDYPHLPPGQPGLIKPDLVAPGMETLSCQMGGSTAKFEGTSAATPHVAGCMALLVEACIRRRTEVRPERIQEALETKAMKLPGQDVEKGKEDGFGSGLIQVKDAFDYGRNKTPPWW
jgi:hypothetical protein